METEEAGMAAFLGKWEQIERTNVKELTRVLGIPEEKREAAQRDMCRETMHIWKEGDYYVFKITSPIGSRENKFKPGEEYDVKTSFANFKSIPRLEAADKKVVQRLLHPLSGESVGTSINEVKNDTMFMTLKISGVESVSTFQRVD